MLKKLGLALLAALAIFAYYVMELPVGSSISREIAIAASADRTFTFLDSLRLTDLWGPWNTVDKKLLMSFAGPDTGSGAKASWDTDGNFGKGSITIVESTPSSRVVERVELERPLRIAQDSELVVTSLGLHSCKVAWTLHGNLPFTIRLASVFIDLDRKVGGLLAMGLSNLKVLVEKESAKDNPSPYQVGVDPEPK